MNTIFVITTIENGKKWNRLVQDLSNYDYRNHQNATRKERFDYYLKHSFIDGAPYLPGMYLNEFNSKSFGFWNNKNKRYYDRYFSPSLGIEKTLSKEIYSSYDNGKGSEFKSGKYYSVASSSRLATATFSEKNRGIVSLIKEISINGQKKKCKVSLEKGLHFYYLFYKNSQYIEEESKKVYTELEEELKTIFTQFRKVYPNIDFGAMYNDQFDTLYSITPQI